MPASSGLPGAAFLGTQATARGSNHFSRSTPSPRPEMQPELRREIIDELKSSATADRTKMDNALAHSFQHSACTFQNFRITANQKIQLLGFRLRSASGDGASRNSRSRTLASLASSSTQPGVMVLESISICLALRWQERLADPSRLRAKHCHRTASQ